MKQILFILGLSGLSLGARAQTPFTTIDSLDINNITASLLVHGDMWWDPHTELSACHFPKDDPYRISFAGSLWMSGTSSTGDWHVSGQTFRTGGKSDYWPGPLDASGNLDYGISAQWAKIWKIDRWDITVFRSHTPDLSSMHPTIKTWPAKGNVYAEGTWGTSLTINTDMAPFVDVNGDGIYNPMDGDYPDIKGDQALWCVFSDNGVVHNETNGTPLKVQVQLMAYAFKRGTLIDNVVYYDYTITNKSANTYNDFRAATWGNVNLGHSYDDGLGFDSTWRMSITYNMHDDTTMIIEPTPITRSRSIVGVTMIKVPGDTGSTHVPIANYISYNNDASIIGNPMNDSQFYYYMHARTRDGQHYIHGTTDVDIVYTGTPGDPDWWSPCGMSMPFDNRIVLSGPGYTLAPGATTKVVMALISTNPTDYNGCSNVSYDSIRVVADTAWKMYNYTPPDMVGTTIVSADRSVVLYPNPAKDQVTIKAAGNTPLAINIYNVIGQQMPVTIKPTANGYVATICALPAGLYRAVWETGGSKGSISFAKE